MRRASNFCTCGDLVSGVSRLEPVLRPAPPLGYWLFPQMTRMLSLDLAIDEQGHVFAVATSPDEFPARSDVRAVCLDGFGSVVAVIDRADIADDDFVEAHDLGLPVHGGCYPHRDRWCQFTWIDAFGGQPVAVVLDRIRLVGAFLPVDHQVIEIDNSAAAVITAVIFGVVGKVAIRHVNLVPIGWVVG